MDVKLFRYYKRVYTSRFFIYDRAKTKAENNRKIKVISRISKLK